ncbi:uncharacterized protein LOC111716641 [Eurytemora carolleeae]|uniref:uncharacterized protein LOC111716641 n=1 Tax=Eurytemora carolleeae TaxID=1294199 RepID=UPI000C75DAED|nr:uncharacterized protein LOC111716641 [Eurytemora carolleeae]|eukprot:XP_023347884.1 uncharacterized protein LOC111716641 [Eurytemora affinis]
MVIWALFMFCISGGRGLDYWVEDYIQENNCLNKEVFQNNGSVCAAVEIRNTDKDGESNKALSKCKDVLSLKLFEICIHTRLIQGGNLTYCNNGDFSFHCCATNYQCEDDWKGLTERNTAKAVQFLQDKETFLQRKVETQGFKTCHPIVGNNASICHEDCKLFENSTFNRQCKSRGGLLKCCIRREKVFCNECQYCCTVPFCSWNSRNVIQLAGEHDFVEEDIYAPIVETKPAPLKVGVQAEDMLSSLNLFYKGGSDTRCLKPDQTKNSSEWDHYLPEDFVKALDEKDLRKARVIKYDNRYLNFEDPEVFTGLTGLHYESIMKETYGFDFVSKSPAGSFRKKDC